MSNKGISKTIADREQQSQEAKRRKAARGHGGGGQTISEQLAPLAPPSILGSELIAELVAGRLLPGVMVNFDGEATFAVGRNNSLLMEKVVAVPELADHGQDNKGVFVTLGQVCRDVFESPLSGKSGEKQVAMREYLRSRLDLEALKKALTTVRTVDYVGHSQEIWNRASDSIDLTKLSGDGTMTEITLGTSAQAGIVLGISFVQQPWSALLVEIGHIGEKHPLHATVPVGTKVKCDRGNFPTISPESREKSSLARGAGAVLDYLVTGIDSIEHELIHQEMMKACKRLHEEQKTATAASEKRSHAPQFGQRRDVAPDGTPPPASKAKAAILTAPATAPAPSDAPRSTNNGGLAAFIAELRKQGVDGAELATFLVAYKESSQLLS